MELTKHKIEQAITLSQAFSNYLTASYDKLPFVITAPQLSAFTETMRTIDASQEGGALKSFLDSLSLVGLRELQAIMFIGRGDFPAKEFTRAFEASRLSGNRNNEASYIMHKMTAPDYLADGFEKLNKARMI